MADILLVNGRFLTMEQPGEIAEAVAIENGKILLIGTEAEARRFADKDTMVIDLQGRVAAPGLIDCHTHPMGSYATKFAYLDLRGVHTASLENLLAQVRKAADTTPKGQWIVGRGFDESKFAEGYVTLTAKLLDKATADHPVCLIRTCGHIAVINSLAMERSGFTDAAEDPATGGHFFKDKDGHLTGMVSGSVLNLVSYPTMTEEQRMHAMIHGVQVDCFRKGVTTTADMGSNAISFRGLQKLDREGKLKLRVGNYFTGRRKPPQEPMAQKLLDVGMLPGLGTGRATFQGIKFVMDGSTGGRTAAFSLPYQDDPNNCGELYWNPEELKEDVYKSALAGLQISIHAIGDRAIEMALDSIEYANARGADTRNLRVRLEHLESPTPAQIQRIKQLNICVGLSSAFIYHLGDSHLAALGYERLVDAFPAKTLIDNGIPFGCNSDCPICDINPMYGVYSMVTRTTEAGRSFGGKKEAIDRMQALEAYTKNAAYVLCMEDVAGTLKAGKYADLVVFEQDYLAVPDEALKDIQIHMTICGGEIVYQNGDSASLK